MLATDLEVPSCLIVASYFIVASMDNVKHMENPGMGNQRYATYKAAQPYFDLVRCALGDLVDGEHFFDIVTDDTIYEVLYDLGWPRVIRGRADLMNAFRGYGDNIELQRPIN